MDDVEELVEELGDQVDLQAEPEAKPEEDLTKEQLRELREENKTLRGRVSEAEHNSQFWHNKAQGAGGGAKAAAVEEEAEPAPLSEDIVDALASGDTRRISKLFGEMGFVKQSEVDKAITSTRAQITEEAKLYGEYPDLQDKNSDFFKSAAAHYNDLAKDPAMAKSPKLIEVAARLAQADMGGREETPAPRRRDDDDADRVRRVASQSGDRGTKSSRTRDADNQDLSPAQANLIAKFQAAGSSLTVENYKKQANAGVRMSGLPRGRR